MATTINTRYVDPDSSGGDGTTNGLSGSTAAYKSLFAWEAARNANLTVGDGGGNYIVERVICGSNHSNHTADTTVVTIDGWTTSANSYIDILTDTASQASAVWSATKYRLAPTSTYTNASCIIKEDFVRFTNVQLGQFGTANCDSAVQITATAAAASSDIRFYGCFLWTKGTRTGYNRALRAESGQVTLRNCILLSDAERAMSATYGSTKPTVNGDNCVFVGGTFGTYALNASDATLTIRNCYARGGATAYSTYVTSMATCASSDTTGSTGLQSIAYDTSTGAGHSGFTNVTAGSEDFHLKSGSALINVGTDLTVYFTTDIDGQARPTGEGGLWDIGADEYISSNQSFSLTGTGGMKGSGAFTFKRGKILAWSGGMKQGGSPTIKSGRKVIASGGVRMSGAATPKRGFKSIATGGMKFSGAMVLKMGRRLLGTGGMKAGTIFAHTSGARVTAHGGMTFGGLFTSLFHKPNYAWTGTGGMKMGGSGLLAFHALTTAANRVIVASRSRTLRVAAGARRLMGGV